MNQYDKMIKTSIPKLITKLSIPSIISMLVTAIYNMADVFFVTQSGGTSPSAAISVVFSLQTLIQATGFSIGMGCGALVSRCLGKNDIEKANNYLNSSLVLGIFIGLIICIFGSIYNEDIMRLLGASVTSLPYAVSYSKWIFIVSPFMISAFIMNASIRNEGKA